MNDSNGYAPRKLRTKRSSQGSAGLGTVVVPCTWAALTLYQGVLLCNAASPRLYNLQSWEQATHLVHPQGTLEAPSTKYCVRWP